MTLTRSPLLLQLVLFAAPGFGAAQYSATVTSVSDGDTLTVVPSPGEASLRLRLSGIDCPEKGQAHAAEARRLTEDLALGQTVTVIEESKDRYGRGVAWVVLADGRSLNETLVAAGLAWWYRRYAPNHEKLAGVESEARARGLGVWADREATEPWEWRKQTADRAASSHRSERRSQPRSHRRDGRGAARTRARG